MTELSQTTESRYKAVLHELSTEPRINIKGENGQGVKLTASEFKFDCSAVFENISTTASISSSEHLAFLDCPELGDIVSLKSIIFKDCPKARSVRANMVFRINTKEKNVFRKYKYSSDLENESPVLYLIGTEITGKVVFKNNQGEQFRGKIFMDPTSKITDLEHTDAVIITLPAESIEDLIKADEALDSKQETAKATTPAEEPAPAALDRRKKTTAVAKKTQTASQEALPK